MTSRLTAIATTAVATVAVLASASLAFAGAFAGRAVQAAAPMPVAAQAVKVIQLERVVITGKRLPQGQ